MNTNINNMRTSLTLKRKSMYETGCKHLMYSTFEFVSERLSCIVSLNKKSMGRLEDALTF